MHFKPSISTLVVLCAGNRWMSDVKSISANSANLSGLQQVQCASISYSFDKVVDLTHPMGESAITWPSNVPFALTKVTLWNWDTVTQVNASRCSVIVLARVMVVSGMRAGTSHNQNIGGFGFLVDRVHIFLPSGTGCFPLFCGKFWNFQPCIW